MRLIKNWIVFLILTASSQGLAQIDSVRCFNAEEQKRILLKFKELDHVISLRKVDSVYIKQLNGYLVEAEKKNSDLLLTNGILEEKTTRRTKLLAGSLALNAIFLVFVFL
jgi:hypothetical protein